jgi:predicted acetyltransferase
MKKGSAIIDDNPHEVFNKICKNKYEIFYSKNKKKSETILDIVVKLGDNIIANADFVIAEDDFHCENVMVVEEHRRKGIGNALYVFAEKVSGRKIENFWENDPLQSDASKKLWNQLDRPFG